MNKHSQQNINDQSLSSYDLIHFAYQISKGMEFISSHGVSSNRITIFFISTHSLLIIVYSIHS